MSLAVLSAVLFSLTAIQGNEEPQDELLTRLALWVIQTHGTVDYECSHDRAGGEKLMLALLENLDVLKPPDDPVDPPPPPPDPIATWTAASDGTYTRLSDNETFQLKDPGQWVGSDSNSSSSKNRQPPPGRAPGDILHLGEGTFPNFRWTITYDHARDVIAGSPDRNVDHPNYPNTIFTYWRDGELRYGLNNRDKFKGWWAWDPEPWFRWGEDPQTTIRGTLGPSGDLLTAVRGGRTYIEAGGAVTFDDLVFYGPVGDSSSAILQTEGPKAKDRQGNEVKENWPDDPKAVASEWQGFRDIELRNVHVDGEWDFESESGPISKWGFLCYEVGRSARGDDVPGFQWIGGSIGGIKVEHCMYFHNTIANSPDAHSVLLSGIEFGPSGRTAAQFHNRTKEGPDGRGKIRIEKCIARDVCMQSGGGGSAFTFGGNHDGAVELDQVHVYLGANPNLAPKYLKEVTGAFVSYAGGGNEGRPTREITVSRCHFQVGPNVGEGASRRPNMQIGNVTKFRMEKTTVKQAVGAREAVHVQDGVGTLSLDPGNLIFGDFRYGAQTWRDVDVDGDGWNDGTAYAAFLEEVMEGKDTNGDGVLARDTGVVQNLIIE